MKKSDEPVVIEKEFAVPVNRLWQALTDPEQMRQWFFDNIPDFRAEEGFKTQFMVDAGERQFLHQWQVTEVQPSQKLAYRWNYDGYEGSGQSVFVLHGEGDRSRLHLSFVIEEDFQDDVPEFERDACLGGWQYFMGQLETYLSQQ